MEPIIKTDKLTFSERICPITIAPAERLARSNNLSDNRSFWLSFNLTNKTISKVIESVKQKEKKGN